MNTQKMNVEYWTMLFQKDIFQKKERIILNFKYYSKRHLNASISLNYSSTI